jgi:predicted ferric reductase
MKNTKKILATYKAEVSTKKTIKITMPKYRAGQEIVLNLQEHYGASTCHPFTVSVTSGKYCYDYKFWRYYFTGLDVYLSEEYLDKNILK